MKRLVLLAASLMAGSCATLTPKTPRALVRSAEELNLVGTTRIGELRVSAPTAELDDAELVLRGPGDGRSVILEDEAGQNTILAREARIHLDERGFVLDLEDVELEGKGVHVESLSLLSVGESTR